MLNFKDKLIEVFQDVESGDKESGVMKITDGYIFIRRTNEYFIHHDRKYIIFYVQGELDDHDYFDDIPELLKIVEKLK